MKELIEYVESKNMRKDLPYFQVGDVVRVALKVVEKDKTRIQNFDGIVIRRSGRGPAEIFTVRHISFGVGVEKTFPVNSPVISGIKVLRAGKVRKACLYYLRSRSGRESRIREDERRIQQLRGMRTEKKEAAATAAPAAAVDQSKLAKRREARGKKKEKRETRRKAKQKKQD